MYGGVQITKNQAIFSGRHIIDGHRITVHDVVLHIRVGMSADEVARGYGLSADEIAAALAHYEEHKAAIDRQMATDRREFTRRAAEDMAPAAERMRDLVGASKRRERPPILPGRKRHPRTASR